MKLYVAGPMTGIPQFNFPVFDEATKTLRDAGHTIITPSELDNPETRKQALDSPDGAPGSGTSNGETWGDFLARDVKLLADEPDLDGIACLPGWTGSRGARLEVFVALLCKKKIFEYHTYKDGWDIYPLTRKEVLMKIYETEPDFVEGWEREIDNMKAAV